MGNPRANSIWKGAFAQVFHFHISFCTSPRAPISLYKWFSQAGRWKPIRLGTHGPPISHLTFVDDILLFVEASVEQIGELSLVLGKFCKPSCQKVNNSKIVIHFSKNVLLEKQNHIEIAGGFKTTSKLWKYLRIPIIHGRVRISTFQSMINRVNLLTPNSLSLYVEPLWYIRCFKPS